MSVCERSLADGFVQRPVDFDTMRWHTVISEYGVSGDDEHMGDDPDATILNKVVEKTVCKKIKDMIPNLDVFSAVQMKSGRHAFEQVSYYVEDSDPAFKVRKLKRRVAKVCWKAGYMLTSCAVGPVSGRIGPFF